MPQSVKGLGGRFPWRRHAPERSNWCMGPPGLEPLDSSASGGLARGLRPRNSDRTRFYAAGPPRLEMPGSTLTNPLAELQNQSSNYEPEPCRQRCRDEPQNPGVTDHDGDFTRYRLPLYP